ncbi:uncharacterized protein B0H18DRAFT_989616 [Fomitopsis serialis]|uniref:uncharacterized protein n=1 Tax=Fomitopsis serialis TaxID=139415 RepID=UPI0020082A7C|nr:uncharacterized protein B0H18DRAFT_989616 [Neoantrodia serialis]KAH9931492.1 hypothetical protein B0H18DRAFT_989616 [Neoantrodia serialis]
MSEHTSPQAIDFIIKDSQLPAYPLERDDDVLRSGYHILRHRHLRMSSTLSATKHDTGSTHVLPTTKRVDGQSVWRMPLPQIGSPVNQPGASTTSGQLPAVSFLHSSIPLAPASAVHIGEYRADNAAKTTGETNFIGVDNQGVPVRTHRPLLQRVVGSNGLRIEVEHTVIQSGATPRGFNPAGIQSSSLSAGLCGGPPIERVASPSALRTSALPASPQPPSIQPPLQTVVGRLHEHAIRSRPEKVRWYPASGPRLVDVPVAPAIASVGDLFINYFGDGQIQVWLRRDPPSWTKVNDSHPHPTIEGYVLRILDNGEPRWVTKETYRTYLGRDKKQERAQDHSEQK